MKEQSNFKFLDVPRAIWFFLDKERVKYLVFSLMLCFSLFFDFIPPYIIGNIVDFLKDYSKSMSLFPLYYYIILLVVISIFAAIIRLSSKRVLLKTSINARYRAKVWGFARLLDFSLVWHQEESAGNKAQRIITGSESIREWTADLMNVIFPALTSFIGSLAACLMLNPLFAFFFIYYIGFLIGIEFIFDGKIAKISDLINKSIENASGVFIESTSNILAVKALGAGDGMTSNVEAKEETAKLLAHKRMNYGVSKWIYFQIQNNRQTAV